MEFLKLCSFLYLQFFQRDVQKVLKWKHEMIVRLYGMCLSPFYVMSQRLVEGRLDSLLHKRGESFQLYHCVRATGQLAQALTFLVSKLPIICYEAAHNLCIACQVDHPLITW